MSDHNPIIEPCRLCQANPPHRCKRTPDGKRVQIICYDCGSLLDNHSLETFWAYIDAIDAKYDNQPS